MLIYNTDWRLDMVKRILPETNRSEVAKKKEEQRTLVPESYTFQISVLQVFCDFYISSGQLY